MAVRRIDKCPCVRENRYPVRVVVMGGAAKSRCTESPEATSVWRPRSVIPKRGTVDSKLERGRGTSNGALGCLIKEWAEVDVNVGDGER
jgi:hypothetical protein